MTKHILTMAAMLIASLVLAALAAVLGLGTMVVLGVSGLATPPTLDGESRTVVSVVLGTVASTGGVVGILATSKLVAGMPGAAWLSSLGAKSMVIFVAHIVFTSGTRIVLNVAGVENLVLQAGAGTAVGVLGPVALGTLAPKLKLGWLFELPRQLDPAMARSRKVLQP